MEIDRTDQSIEDEEEIMQVSARFEGKCGQRRSRVGLTRAMLAMVIQPVVQGVALQKDQSVLA